MKYTMSAEKCKLVDFSKRVDIIPYARNIKNKLKDIEKNRRRYVIVATGNQGEPDSVLSKMLDGRLPFRFEPADHVIFSTRVIPDPVNLANRNRMEEKLRERRVRIFTNIHVSGHASREDHRDMLNILKPKYLMPAHDGREKQLFMKELALEEGLSEKQVLLMDDGKKVALDL